MSKATDISTYLIFVVSSILVFWIICAVEVEGSKCPGQCISPQKCKEKGGKILAYCTNSKACCEDPQEKHGDCNENTWNSREAYFKSPKYPEETGGNLVCQFRMNLFHSTVGVKIDFIDFYLPMRPGNDLFGKETIHCDSDMFFIRGFSDWMPDARCGNLTDHSIVLELDEGQQYISLLFVMSSVKYKWNVKITQISKEDVLRKEKCLNTKMEMWNKEIGEEYEYTNANPNITETTNVNEPLQSLNSFEDYNLDENFIGPMPLIVHGEVSQVEEIPWQISIQKLLSLGEKKILQGKNLSVLAKSCPYYSADYIHICGGSIIGERHILTAAHCISSKSLLTDIFAANYIKVHVGDFDFCLLNETHNFGIHTVEKITLHYNYIVGDIGNDIAVIKLKEKIKFGKTVRPIPLASLLSENLEYENSTKFLLSGWGNSQSIDLLRNPCKQPKPSYPTKMRKTTHITVNDLDYCNVAKYYELAGIIENGTAEEASELLSNKYQGFFTKWICTSGDADGTPSYGDSGGPLVALDENWKNPQLIGVVSHLQAFYLPVKKKAVNSNYFSKVSSYLSWILMAFEECE